ncbi:hypothetical protein VTK26DRAFT_9076 [Humicola hyalothermophila]
MASLTEFYLTGLWAYTPKAVNRILDSLTDIASDEIKIVYDEQYHWFRVICPEHDVANVRERFQAIAGEIENDAFDEDDNESILDSDGIIKESFNNEWINLERGSLSADQEEEEDGPRCAPKELAEFSHISVWDDLDKNNESLTIKDIVTADQLIRITNETGVATFRDLPGRLVYIGGNDEESVNKVRDKLRVMLEIKKIAATRFSFDHIVYAEDYVDPTSDRFRADLRYLANIDLKLVSSTLFDRIIAVDLETSYRRTYEQGASIRLCRWDENRENWFSFFGPDVAPKCSGHRIFVNRPTVSAKTVDSLGHGPRLTASRQQQSHEVRTQVASWIEALPDSVVSGVGGHVGGSADQLPASIATTGSVSKKQDNDHDEAPAVICLTAPQAYAAPATAKRGIVDPLSAGATPRISGDARSASTSRKVKAPLTAPGLANSGNWSKGQVSKQESSKIPFTGPDCLIDMLDAVETVSSGSSLKSSIRWEMPPLIPPPSGNEKGKGAETNKSAPSASSKSLADRTNDQATSDLPAPTPPTTGVQGYEMEKRRFMAYLKSGATGFKPTKKKNDPPEVETRPVSGPETLFSRNKTQPTGSSNTQTDHGHHPSTSQVRFDPKVEAAIVRLLSRASYRRGNLSLKAEFGRVILHGLEPESVAFNPADKPANGWTKKDLLEALNVDYGQGKSLDFTKVLTTYAWDVEDMIDIKSNETRLWEQKPTRSWVTYSFHCAISGMNGISFIVDVEDNGSSSNDIFTYSIRQPGRSRALTPVYVHAIQHHWDVRIVLTHADTETLETAFGAFARTLLHSLSISCTDNGSPLLKFAVHNSFPVEITDARILTRWRHNGIESRSILEITEVEQLEICPYSAGAYSASKDGWEGSMARRWTFRETRERRDNGNFPRWYEAAVMSLDAEEMLRENAVMEFGERAKWGEGDLQTCGFLADVYGPALEMVKKMDRVGRNDNNHQSGKYQVNPKPDDRW